MTDILCGELANSAMIVVDITFPQKITISNVSVTYYEGKLRNLNVYWMKLVRLIK